MVPTIDGVHHFKRCRNKSIFNPLKNLVTFKKKLKVSPSARHSVDKIRTCFDWGVGKTYPTVCTVVSTTGAGHGKFSLPPLADAGIDFLLT